MPNPVSLQLSCAVSTSSSDRTVNFWNSFQLVGVSDVSVERLRVHRAAVVRQPYHPAREAPGDAVGIFVHFKAMLGEAGLMDEPGSRTNIVVERVTATGSGSHLMNC